MRPWEYFNEFAGGPKGAYKYFSDEGTDLGLRVAEIARYYDEELKPNGEIPFIAYFSSFQDRKRRGIDWVGKDPERDAPRLSGDTVEGTIIMGAENLSPKLWWDVGKPLREVEPIARFGNVFVFRGRFPREKAGIARIAWYRAMYTKINVPEPDLNAGMELLVTSAELDPKAFYVSLELGNQYLKLGRRDDALRAYQKSLEFAPRSDGIYDLLAEQVRRIESEPIESIAPLRNPGVE
jgi:tetratricopeptide (TPR) repeat protein